MQREPVAGQDRDHVEERAGAGHRVHEGDAADQHEAPVRGEQAELGPVRHVGRLRGSSAGRTARVSGIASQATAEATSDVTA